VIGCQNVDERDMIMTPDPYAADAKRLIQIQAEIDADHDHFLNNTDPLSIEDMALAGTLTQIFNYCDFNARRIIDTVRHAALGPAERNGGLLKDAQVYEKLVETMQMLPENYRSRNDIVVAANTLKMHHTLRHHFAHWAMRRVPNYDGLFMMTYNVAEGQKKTGKRTEAHEATYGVLPLGPVRAEVSKLEENGKLLAEAAARMHDEFDSLKKLFDDQKAADKAAKEAQREANRAKWAAMRKPKPS
jgi:hypothetical protein